MSEQTQHFDGTIEKVLVDGTTRALSSYLDPGERLAYEVDAENSKDVVNPGTSEDESVREPVEDPTSSASAPTTPSTPRKSSSTK